MRVVFRLNGPECTISLHCYTKETLCLFVLFVCLMVLVEGKQGGERGRGQRVITLMRLIDDDAGIFFFRLTRSQMSGNNLYWRGAPSAHYTVGRPTECVVAALV